MGSKAIAILGPLLYALISAIAGPREAVFAVLPFLVFGMLIIFAVREPRRQSEPRLNTDARG